MAPVDSRFDSVRRDPRFLQHKKTAAKVSIDARFKAVLDHSGHFGTGSSWVGVGVGGLIEASCFTDHIIFVIYLVKDKYGRGFKKRDNDTLRRLYNLEDDNDQADKDEDKDEDDGDVDKEDDDEEDDDVEDDNDEDNERDNDEDEEDEDEDDDDNKMLRNYNRIRGEGLVLSDRDSEDDDSSDEDQTLTNAQASEEIDDEQQEQQEVCIFIQTKIDIKTFGQYVLN